MVELRRVLPGQDQRLNQYRQNKVSLNAVSGLERRPNDWVVTITFYTALHLIEKSLITKVGKSHRNHEKRKELVVDEEVLGEDVADAYLALYNDCLIARYDCIPTSPKKATDAIALLDIIEKALA